MITKQDKEKFLYFLKTVRLYFSYRTNSTLTALLLVKAEDRMSQKLQVRFK